MAWGSLGTLGSGTSKTSGTSVSLTTSAAAAVGNVIVVIVAFDNVNTFNGDNGVVTSITDSAGNTYTKAREFENAQGAAAAGAGVSVWFSKVSTQLNSSQTITANFNSSLTAKAITAWKFSIASGNNVSVEAGESREDDGADPGSMDLTVPNAEFLWVRGIAKEGVTGTFTKTTAYDGVFTQAGTSGGGAVTNMSVVGEFDIFTGTSNPSDPTWTTSTADHASVLVALKEAGSQTFFETIAAVAVGVPVIASAAIYPRSIDAVALGVPEITSASVIGHSIDAVAVGIPAMTQTATYSRSIDAIATAIPVMASTATYSRSVDAVAVGVPDLISAATYNRSIDAVAVGVPTVDSALLSTEQINATATGTADVSAAVIYAQTIAAIAVGVASMAEQFIAGAGEVFRSWIAAARHLIHHGRN